ncbi:ATP-binding protein [Actinoallomurus soli]|uniref:ATP-binding protein n=1 Tax=Actinoallomurus soli TaxID=2952535 RepID=UPI002093514B|nr:ATP-binding protein [Actinoallomurus soli]MCO5972933.1 ATP-binding protein [Actinoallomurus soli]
METAIGGIDPKVVPAGGCAAWPLPPDPTGARFARSVLKAVFGELRMPAVTTYDAAVALSELATNVHVHAYGGVVPACPPIAGLPELWAYLRWRARPEVVFAVYDSAPWRGPVPDGRLRPPPDAEGGRGFEVVDALTTEYGGEWGMYRTRSRLGAGPVLGKAVYFTVPVPAGLVTPGACTARRTAEEIHALLAARGLGPLQLAIGYGMAVICVRAGMHVWVRDGSISYRAPGLGVVRHSPYDRVEVVERIVRHCADLDAVDESDRC